MSADHQLLRSALTGAVWEAERAINTWPEEAQLRLANEELGELITEIARYGRGRSTKPAVADECADAIIMAIQAGMLIAGEQELTFAINRKVMRLRQRIDEIGYDANS